MLMNSNFLNYCKDIRTASQIAFACICPAMLAGQDLPTAFAPPADRANIRRAATSRRHNAADRASIS